MRSRASGSPSCRQQQRSEGAAGAMLQAAASPGQAAAMRVNTSMCLASHVFRAAAGRGVCLWTCSSRSAGQLRAAGAWSRTCCRALPGAVCVVPAAGVLTQAQQAQLAAQRHPGSLREAPQAAPAAPGPPTRCAEGWQGACLHRSRCSRRGSCLQAVHLRDRSVILFLTRARVDHSPHSAHIALTSITGSSRCFGASLASQQTSNQHAFSNRARSSRSSATAVCGRPCRGPAHATPGTGEGCHRVVWGWAVGACCALCRGFAPAPGGGNGAFSNVQRSPHWPLHKLP